VFPRDMVCLRNISVDTLHKGDTDDDDNNNNNNNNNNKNKNSKSRKSRNRTEILPKFNVYKD
jgi:hypothetical protein